MCLPQIWQHNLAVLLHSAFRGLQLELHLRAAKAVLVGHELLLLLLSVVG